MFHSKENRYRRLGDVSPVECTLKREQFDDYVKRVRIYVHPRLRDALQRATGSKHAGERGNRV